MKLSYYFIYTNIVSEQHFFVSIVLFLYVFIYLFSVLDLLSKGVSVNFNATQGEGMTLLHQACVYDDYIIAQALIKQGIVKIHSLNESFIKSKLNG